ncbi:hypothetical protein Ancab_018658 [Ancistrocladus abbreviatus]
MRNSKDVEKEEYQEFYKKTSNEFFDPLAYAHCITEGEMEFHSVLYIPGMALLNNEDIFLRYLSFVKGVVDSDDLPLNVSRKILQDSRIVRCK